MTTGRPLNLFYEEPERDRWITLDRYPRRLIRRVIRGVARPGGHKRVFLNLCAGLQRIGIAYRVNDYRHALDNPHEVVCIIGKPFVLDKQRWRNPILFGAAGYSHPVDDPDLLQRLPVKKILVPGPWMKTMCEPAWGNAVEAWPVGIDTGKWGPSATRKAFDLLLYDKALWNREKVAVQLVEPIRRVLRNAGLSFREIRYGCYQEREYRDLLAQCRAMIFLCEHETQGIAYQEALSCGIPIFAWDQGGPWQDPSYFPNRVLFQPVSSVPYWDDRCGLKFSNAKEFEARLGDFWDGVQKEEFTPRDYIMENLTLEKCAGVYSAIARCLDS